MSLLSLTYRHDTNTEISADIRSFAHVIKVHLVSIFTPSCTVVLSCDGILNYNVTGRYEFNRGEESTTEGKRTTAEETDACYAV